MITWFGYLTIAVSIIQALVCAFQGLRKREPNDYTMGATLLVALLLVVQIVISIIAPFAGNPPTGDLLEVLDVPHRCACPPYRRRFLGAR